LYYKVLKSFFFFFYFGFICIHQVHLSKRRRRRKMAGGGGGAAAPPKQEELLPHPVKDQLPNVSYCITSPPPWREFNLMLLHWNHFFVFHVKNFSFFFSDPFW
jgi:hypothetical protein